MSFTKKKFHPEENCLNCNYPLIGQFCAQCGQKAFLHKDSFWHMALHFVGDYFHYNSKFWITFKTLFQKPGQITIEYNQGKRAKYLNPIQLYIFITTLFFLLTFSLGSASDVIEIKTDAPDADSAKLASIQQVDSLVDNEMASETEKGEKQRNVFGHGKYVTADSNLRTYDSLQKALPESEKDGFILSHFTRRGYVLEERYKGDKTLNNKFVDIFFHNIPKVFFILLPYFAFLLWVFFRKKNLYYVDHLIFSFHFHSFVFVVLTFLFICKKILPWKHLTTGLSLLVFVGIGVHLFLSLKKVYGGSSMIMLLKQILLFFCYMIFFGFVSTASIVLIFFMI